MTELLEALTRGRELESEKETDGDGNGSDTSFHRGHEVVEMYDNGHMYLWCVDCDETQEVY